MTDGRDQLDRIADVAQSLSTAGLVQDAADLGSKRGGLCREEDFTAACGGGYAGGEVDGGADVVPVSLDRRSVMHSYPHGWGAVAGEGVVSDPESEEHRLSRVFDPKHECVADGLDLRSPKRGQLGPDGVAKVRHQPCGVFVCRGPRSAR